MTVLGGYGFIILTLVEALFAIPSAVILKRIGRNPWWALLCFVPILALVGLWVLAFLGRKSAEV